MFRKLLRAIFNRHCRLVPEKKVQHRARLWLEVLEDRTAPAAFTFVGPGTAWDALANWTADGAPATALPGRNDDVTIPGGQTAVLSSSDDANILSLTVSGGTLTVNGTLDVTNFAAFTGAGTVTIGGSGNLDDAGTLDSAIAAFLTVNGKLEFGSTATPAGIAGPLNIVQDQPNGIDGDVEVNGNATISSANVTVGGILDAKNINAQSGAALDLTGTGVVLNNGNIDTGINASATFDLGSSYTIASGGQLHGDGTYVIDASLTVDGPLTGTGDIQLNSDGGTTTNGALVGGGSLDMTAEFTWTGGTISLGGGVTVETNYHFTVAGPNTCTLNTDLNSDSYYFDVNSPLTLATGAVLTNLNPAPSMSLSSTISGAGTFDNDGTLQCESTTVAPVISSVFNQSGSGIIEMGAGAKPLTLSGTGTLAGELTLNGSSLDVTGSYTVPVGAQLETSTAKDGYFNLSTGGTLTLGAGSQADIGHFTLGGGTLAGAGTLTIGESGNQASDNFNWDAGTLSGTGTLDIVGVLWNNQLQGCTLNLGSPGSTNTLILSGWTLKNSGFINWYGSTLQLTDFNTGSSLVAPTIDNEASALFDDEGTGTFQDMSMGATFDNQGEFLKDSGSGSGTLVLPMTFDNDAPSGGGATDGLVEVKSGTLSLSGQGGGMNPSGGSSSGTFQADSGATVQFASNYTLTGGGLAGPGTIDNSGYSTLSVTGSTQLSGGVTLDNTQNAQMQVSADMPAGTGGGTIDNAGTFITTATATIGALFDSTHQVEAQAGTLTLAGGGSSSDTLQVAAGTTLQFAQQNYTVSAGYFTGAGTVDNQTQLTLANTLGFDPALTNEGTLEVQGWLDLGGGGSSSGTLQADSGATLQLMRTGFTLTGGALTGSGTIENGTTLAVTGSLALSGGVTLKNDMGAKIQDSSDVTAGTGGGTLVNSGQYVKTTGAGTASIDVIFTNSGTAEAQAGTLGFNGGGSSANGSSFTSDSGAAVAFGNGTYTLGSGTALSGAGAFQVTGGQVVVTGGVTGTQASLTLAGGTLQVTDTGTLQVGSFTEQSGATLEVDLGATSFGTLDVQGVAALAGALDVVLTGYQPQPGDNRAIINYASYSGSFGSVTVPSGLDYVYNATNFSVYDPS